MNARALLLLFGPDRPDRPRFRVNGAAGDAAAETTGLPLIGHPREAACAAALLRHKCASEAGLPGPAFGDLRGSGVTRRLVRPLAVTQRHEREVQAGGELVPTQTRLNRRSQQTTGSAAKQAPLRTAPLLRRRLVQAPDEADRTLRRRRSTT